MLPVKKDDVAAAETRGCKWERAGQMDLREQSRRALLRQVLDQRLSLHQSGPSDAGRVPRACSFAIRGCDSTRAPRVQQPRPRRLAPLPSLLPIGTPLALLALLPSWHLSAIGNSSRAAWLTCTPYAGMRRAMPSAAGPQPRRLPQQGRVGSPRSSRAPCLAPRLLSSPRFLLYSTMGLPVYPRAYYQLLLVSADTSKPCCSPC